MRACLGDRRLGMNQSTLGPSQCGQISDRSGKQPSQSLYDHTRNVSRVNCSVDCTSGNNDRSSRHHCRQSAHPSRYVKPRMPRQAAAVELTAGLSAAVYIIKCSQAKVAAIQLDRHMCCTGDHSRSAVLRRAGSAAVFQQ